MNGFLEIDWMPRGSSVRRVACVAALGLLLLAAAGAASPAGAPAAAAGKARYLNHVFGRADVTYDITYGHAVDQNGQLQALKLDLYQPAGDTAQARPVVIYMHGGAFTRGNKTDDRNVEVVDDFARRGWVATSINFRLDGQEKDETDDLQASVRWFKAHAAEYRIDPTRIVVSGSSSGAVSSLDANFDPEDAGNSGNPGYPSNVAGALSISGTAYDASSIGPGDPPIAMFHAMDDTTIPFAAAEATCQQTQAVGNVCEMKAYQSGGHPPGFLAANRDEILQLSSEFLCRRVLAPHACDPPDIAAPITTDDVPAGFHNHPVSVTLSATDTGGSGLDKTYYTTGTSPPTPTTSSPVYSAASKPTLANGERIRYFSTDHAGNAEAVKSSPAAKVDTAAPSTTDDVPAGLQNRPATVTLSATDTGGSGLDKTYYTTGANPPDPTASSAVYNGAAKPTLADGERIKYFSTDRAGNAEAVKSSPAAKVGSAGPDEITTLEQPATQPVAFLEGTLAATRKGVVKFSLVNPNSFAVTEAVKIMTASPVALRLGAARKHKTKRVLTLGADRLSIPAGQRTFVKIRLSKSGRKLLARKGRLALRLGLSTQGPKGGPVASSRTVRPKVR